ncbi:DUF979 domain-containing protein [Acetobacteraceae bacterium KSS8]|uniref:DUF979 domain-containing protein n=1 Tax=Endosaccharibacter trunci TaxID=2812733 RepID=A0ABT1W595_9PROT|nr:DUF979 domain-containing protein [Acetobacteraceae bacterium KSS8]
MSLHGDTVLGIVLALLPAAAALHHLADRDAPRRYRNAAFWGAFALTAGAGPFLPNLVNGALVLLMVALATIGLRPGAARSTTEAERTAASDRFGYRLFLPALSAPLLTFAGAVLLPKLTWHGRPLTDPHNATLYGLTIGLLAATAFALMLTRPPRDAIVLESRRLSDDFGWAMVLPQLLAALGGIFAVAGVGKVLAAYTADVVPFSSPLIVTSLFAIGMAGLTVLIGNAFTAFPIMMGGIGIPVLVRHLGADPAIVASLGMLSGFCGTLVSPMAATFNLVPTTLLDLRSQYAVIRVQAPTALLLLLVNILVLLVCAFPGAPR